MMTYKQWLEGDCGCGNVSPCSHKDVCDCENILLELEKQHVDDLTLQDEIDFVSGVVETISGCTGGSVIVDEELSLTSTNPVQNKVITGALNGKLDSSAYTPTDLSDYYTKEQVDALIPEVPSLSGYATEQWVEDKHYITGVDLSDYATKEEIPVIPTNVSSFINDAGYITNSELIQYITNLQQQINSLTSAISGCCGESGETQYRWVTMTGENDYWCSGTTKYSKEKEQSSTDGIVWSDTGNIRSGNTVLEENCVDCGYTPISQNANISLGYDLINDLSGQTTYKISNSCESNVNYINVCVHSAEGNFCDNNRICSTSITKNELDAIHMPTSQWPLRTFGVRINKTDGLIKSYEYYNSDFKDVTLYSGVTSIGDYAFANNQYLVSAGRDQYSGTMYLTSIGNYAFANNPLLTTINLWGLGSGVPTLGTGAFDNCPNLAHIYVDSSLVNAFKTAPGWSAFANIIESGT